MNVGEEERAVPCTTEHTATVRTAERATERTTERSKSTDTQTATEQPVGTTERNKSTDLQVITVDANGLSCPEPLMMLKVALDNKSAKEIMLLVDNNSALENCTWLAKRKKCLVDVQSNNGAHRIHITRP